MDLKESGILLIDKPEGITTFDIIRKIKKFFYEQGRTRKTMPKIGHAGTLDPFATGLVIILIGKATKLSDSLMGQKKTYIAQLKFGEQTNTADLTGEMVSTSPLPSNISARWEFIQSKFLDQEYWQTPPMFSAKKINGQKLYELARKGIEVKREKKLKKIYSLKLLEEILIKTSNQTSEITFEAEVQSGTYVRTLAEDISQTLECVGHLRKLNRTHSGNYSLNQSHPLNSLTIENFLGFLITQ